MKTPRPEGLKNQRDGQLQTGDNAVSHNSTKNEKPPKNILTLHRNEILPEHINGIEIPTLFYPLVDHCFDTFLDRKDYLAGVSEGAKQCQNEGSDLYRYFCIEYELLRNFSSEFLEQQERKATAERKKKAENKSARLINLAVLVLTMICAATGVWSVVHQFNQQTPPSIYKMEK